MMHNSADINYANGGNHSNDINIEHARGKKCNVRVSVCLARVCAACFFLSLCLSFTDAMCPSHTRSRSFHSEHIIIRINCTPKIASECLSPPFVVYASEMEGEAVESVFFVYLCLSSSAKMKREMCCTLLEPHSRYGAASSMRLCCAELLKAIRSPNQIAMVAIRLVTFPIRDHGCGCTPAQLSHRHTNVVCDIDASQLYIWYPHTL